MEIGGDESLDATMTGPPGRLLSSWLLAESLQEHSPGSQAGSGGGGASVGEGLRYVSLSLRLSCFASVCLDLI